MYASLCDFVCIASSAFTFVLGFCLSVFLLCFVFSIVLVLVIIAGFLFWFGFSLLSFFPFFLLLFNFVLFNNFYFNFNNFILITLLYFILFYFSFFLSFFSFLPFLLSHAADRVLVLWLRVRPEPLRWET